ncbi:MAG: hypothetical protein NTW29_10775 [Bacteroidetes bacterium]|nr:hypothetical protein [Bacteroidota bacterium]
MRRIRPDVDIILDLLNAVLAAHPDSAFTQSLLVQYQERGGLSKKQLEGLYGKASRLKDIPPGKLATLEAIILKKKGKQRSALPPNTPLYKADNEALFQVNQILEKFPAHKRVLFFRSKLENNEPLSGPEKTELKRFMGLLK